MFIGHASKDSNLLSTSKARALQSRRWFFLNRSWILQGMTGLAIKLWKMRNEHNNIISFLFISKTIKQSIVARNVHTHMNRKGSGVMGLENYFIRSNHFPAKQLPASSSQLYFANASWLVQWPPVSALTEMDSWIDCRTHMETNILYIYMRAVYEPSNGESI